MADWDESEHPRDTRGRFRDKTGWAGAVADRLSGGLWGRRVRAKDGLINVADMGSLALESLRDSFNPQDEMLAEIYRRRGFDGPPRVVSEAEMDELVETGEVIEVWRGIERHQDRVTGEWTDARTLAEQYRTGPYFAGQGIRGNGTYTTTDRHRAEVGYSEPGGLLRIGLAADARIVTYREFTDLVADYTDPSERFKRHWLYGSQSDEMLQRATREEIVGWVLHDEGRLAAAMGIDAIKVDRGAGGGHYFVILNRTATVVQEAR
jgi:hypothetical protein